MGQIAVASACRPGRTPPAPTESGASSHGSGILALTHFRTPAAPPMSETALSELQEKVRRIEIVSRRIVTEKMAGEYHSVFKGQGMEFEEVRPYTPGDEIRTIDWNVTARAGEAHVKRYREEREQTVMLVVDVSASCRFGARGAFKSETMAEVCAVLAFASLANNDRVGLVLCSDDLELVVPARKGRRHALRIVREVLAFEPRSGGTDLSLGLDHLRHMLHRRSIVFLLSDFLALDFETALAGVARRHDLIGVAFDDPLEREIPAVGGMLDLVDAETGATFTVDASDRAWLASYRDSQTARRDARRRLLLRNEAGLVELETGRPWEGEIVRFFRHRARRRR